MADNPNTLPADFFSRQKSDNPDTLPADFFSGTSSKDSAPTKPTAPKPPERTFGGELWNEIKSGPANLAAAGRGIMGSVMGAVVDPVGQARAGLSSLGAPIAETATKAKEAAQRGDVPGAVRGAVNTGINVALPGTGSRSEEAGEMYSRGEYAPATGKTLGIGANVALGVEGPNIVRGAGNVARDISNLRRVDPRVATERALKATPAEPNFSKRVPETLRTIKASNKGEIPTGITEGELDLVPVTNKAIAEHQAVMDQWVTRAKGVQVSGDALVEATRKAIPKLVWTESPEVAQAMVADAQRAFGGKMFPVEDFRDFLKTGNASKFFGQKPAAQQSAAATGSPPAIEAARTDAIRNTLYPALDPEGAGAGPRLIQRKTGDLINVRDAASRRTNAIIAEQPLTPIGRFLEPVKHALQSTPGAAMLMPHRTGTGLAFAEGSEGRSLPLLNRAFKSVGNEPVNVLPRPGSPLYPIGNPQRQLPAPGPITPPPVDTSFVRGTPGMGQPLNPRRALPSPDLIPPAPMDESSVRGVPGMTAPPTPGRALPRAQTIQVPPSPITPPTGETIPTRTGVPGQDPSSVRSVGGKFPTNIYDASAMQRFGKPFAALTQQQKQVVQADFGQVPPLQ